MLSVLLLATGLVVTLKVAVVALAATVTLAGTCAAAVLPLDRVTIAPPAGAEPFKVTVPVDVPPPKTDAGLTLTDASTAAVTVKLAFWATPYAPEMVSDVVVPTGLVVTLKVAVVAFAATVTVACTCAAAVLLLDRVTTAPPAGAGPLSVTVPVDELPPSADVGLRATELRTGAVTVKAELWVVP